MSQLGTVDGFDSTDALDAKSIIGRGLLRVLGKVGIALHCTALTKAGMDRSFRMLHHCTTKYPAEKGCADNVTRP